MTHDIAYSLDVEFKRIRNYTVGAFWKMISVAREIRRTDAWNQLGYESFAEYLAQPELSLKVSSINNYITALNRFEELGLSPESYSKLPKTKARLIAPHLDKGDPRELLTQAQSLSWSDLKAEIKLLTDGEEPEETGRPAKPKIVWCDEHQKWWIKEEDLRKMCIHP